MQTTLNLLAVLALVLLNGFFVAAEFALVKVRATRLEELARRGNSLARQAAGMHRNLDAYLSATQLGITLASLGLGWIGEPAIAHLIEGPLERLHLSWLSNPGFIAIAIAFFIITTLHIVIGELAPKSLAIQRSEAVTLWVALPLKFFYWLLYPFIVLLNGIASRVLRWVGVQPAGEAENLHSPEELIMLIRQGAHGGMVEKMEARMADRVFRFGDLRTQDVMIHRLAMFALDIRRPIDELLDDLARNYHTRVPLYDGEIDRLVGILHMPDFVKALRFSEDPSKIDLRQLVRPALQVPEQLHLDRLLEEMRSHRTQIAIVRDEYGAVVGLTTLEDIVEEVFGEIQDELEAEQPPLWHAHDGRIIARGEVRLDEIETELGVSLEAESTQTLAAYVASHLGSVPRPGDVVETPGGKIRVENMAGTRITQVAILPAPNGQRPDILGAG